MASDSGPGKSNVDDISLEEPSAKRRSSAGPLMWFVLILIIAAVAIWLYVSYEQRQKAALEAQERENAATARIAQTTAAKQNVTEAITLADQGNLEAAIAKLQAAENQYGAVVSNANIEGNSTAAAQALKEKQVLADARQAIEAERDRMQQAIKAQLDVVRTEFGISAPAAATESTDAAATDQSQVAPATDQAAPATTGEAAPATDGTAAPGGAGAMPATPDAGTATAPATPAVPTAPAAQPSGG